MKTDGYFEMIENGKLISCVYGKITRNGKEKTCKCCGKKVANYFDTVYIDENDNEVCGTYGLACFKKIAILDDSVIEI